MARGGSPALPAGPDIGEGNALVSGFDTIGLISHLAAALGFAGLGLALGLRPNPTGFRLAVALASLLTAFWAAAILMVGRYDLALGGWIGPLETVRTAAWIGVLVVLQRHSWGLDSRPSSSFLVAALLGFVVALQLALDLVIDGRGLDLSVSEARPAATLYLGLRLVVAISGLVLLHNLYINAREASALNFRLFAVALALLFAYDLNLYTLNFLLGTPSRTLLEVRGAVNALAVPLLFLAMRGEGEPQGLAQGFRLSRQAAFHTVSFSMIGGYLITMSALAYGLKLTGGDWGVLLQVTFLSAAVVVGALVFLSQRFRAQLRLLIARNFYRYRYDYRLEWLRFIDIIDGDALPGRDRLPIRERFIMAVATVLDSPGGALMEPAEGGGYELTARWQWAELAPPRIAEGSALSQFLAEDGGVVDFERLRRADGESRLLASPQPLVLPDWARTDPGIWIAVPLIRREALSGILLLKRSIAMRDLNWEDQDLLRTLGRQGASYIAEAETQAQLDEARSFEEYSRRFAFVMHDLKNVVSQLGLVARNAARHADKPEFQADMVATLNGSVAKMTDLMALLGREKDGRPTPAPAEADVDIADVTMLVAATMRRQHPAITVDGAEAPTIVRGDAARLEALLTHLVQNAIDASAPDAPIALELVPGTRQVRVLVTDHGHGMSQSFIRDDLFKPFRSTKEGGFGIGAFEAREIARSHGGRLDVQSRPGEGTRFTLLLPRAPVVPTDAVAPPPRTQKMDARS